MQHCRRTDRRAGLTLIEVVAVVLVVALLAGVFLPALGRWREKARSTRCAEFMHQLAMGMATYLNEHGDGRFFPCPLGRGTLPDTYNGAEWLALLYWTDCIPDPGVFLCPNSDDTNHDGLDLGNLSASAAFGSQTVSYAGMHYYSKRDKQGKPIPGAIPDDYPPNKPMASDDTQGDINHGTLRNGGMNVLFFDAHVEFRTHTELDLRRAVGQEGGLLEELAN